MPSIENDKGGYNNCYVYKNGSKFEKSNNGTTYNYAVHFMRPVNTYDLEEDQDIAIEPGHPVSAQLVFKWKGDQRAKGTTIELV